MGKGKGSNAWAGSSGKGKGGRYSLHSVETEEYPEGYSEGEEDAYGSHGEGISAEQVYEDAYPEYQDEQETYDPEDSVWISNEEYCPGQYDPSYSEWNEDHEEEMDPYLPH